MTFFNKLNLFLIKQLLPMRYVLGALAFCFLTSAVQAQTGKYLNFDGTNDVITATQQTTVKNNFTIEFWARPTETIALPAQATSGFGAISGQRFAIYPVDGSSISAGSVGAGVSVGTNGICVVEHGAGYIPSLLTWTGTISGWTHIAVVYTNKQPTLYINGVLTATGLTSLQTNVFVTTNRYGGGSFGSFSGDMDELRIWNTSLSAANISSRKNTELVGNEAGLIDYYQFNQGTPAGTNTGVTTLTDATTPANNGTLNTFALTGTASNWLASSPNLLAPSVTIAASSTICPGTSVTFTATPTNGGSSPTYLWKNGSTDVGTGDTYTTTGLANSDVITCVMTSNLANASPTTATAQITAVPATTLTIFGTTAACNTTTLTASNNGSLNFTNNSTYINVPDANSLDLTNAVTLEAWIKPTSASGVLGTIVSKNRAARSDGYYMALLYSGGGATLRSGMNDGTLNAYIDSNTPIPLNTWSHVAVTFGSGMTTMYLNGVQIKQTAASGNFSFLNSTQPLTIGNAGSIAGLFFMGEIDEVRVWNTVRTQTQLQDDKSRAINPQIGLVAYYRFNETTGTTAIDVSGNSNTGTLQGAITRVNPTTSPADASTYVWSSGVTTAAATLTQTGTYTATVTDANGCTAIATQAITITSATTTPSVSIAASLSGTITIGTSVTFTAVPTNGGTAPTYVWKKGGMAIIGQTAATYTSTTLANGDIITCEMTPSAEICPTVATATSTGITMSVTSVYTWTGATSTDWATATNWNPNGIPSPTDNVIIPTTTNKPMLPANQTIANMDLTGTNKVMLGNSTLCVNAITGGSSSSYVVTDGTGSLIIKTLPTNAATTFPIGVSETSYDPLSIRPTNSVDFTAKVKNTTIAGDFSGSIANFAKTAKRQWDITPSATAGSTVLTLINGGTAYTVVGTPKVGHYNGTTWTELAATHNSGTWTATTSVFSPFGVGEAGGFVSTVLPVELLTFTGYNKGTVNILNWATANEVNNKGFQVERLMDNGQWIILGFVNAHAKASTYSFTDNTPLSTSYYRLRQIDNDGREMYSKVISVSLKGNNKLKVYPNPVSNVLTVERNAVPFTNDDFQILNLLGQQVLTGKAAQRIDVSALPQGAYFLKVGTEQVKFVKQ